MSKAEIYKLPDGAEVYDDEGPVTVTGIAVGGLRKIVRRLQGFKPSFSLENLLPGERAEPLVVAARTPGVEEWRQNGGI